MELILTVIATIALVVFMGIAMVALAILLFVYFVDPGVIPGEEE